ncbi:MAG TPA: extracellular solute-binding protein [Chloroflexota bacterium]|nr:extracellular solute-binding protein [Chloroflexota bacterium]
MLQGSGLTRGQVVRSSPMVLAGGLAAACGVSEAPPVASARSVTLQIDNNWVSPPDRLSIMQAWLERVKRVYPNIKTELTDLAARPDTRAAAFASNTYGELFMGDLTVNPTQNATIYQDIDPTLKSLRFDTNSIYDIPVLTHYGGKRYGTLVQLNSWVWVYNKSMFKTNGVAEPTAKWTWNDHLDAAKRLAKPADNKWGMQVVGDNPFQWFWQAGAEYVAKDGKSSLFTTKECVNVLQWLIDIAQKFHVGPTFSENKAQAPKFVNGVMATDQLSAPGHPLNSQINNQFEWDVMPTPKHPTSGKPAPMLVTGGPMLVTQKATQHDNLREAVQALVEFYNKEVQQLYNDGSRNPTSLPALKSVANSAEALKPPPQNLKVVVDQIATGRQLDVLLPGAGVQQFRNGVWTHLYAALDGKLSAEQAALNMKRDCDRVLSDATATIPDPR